MKTKPELTGWIKAIAFTAAYFAVSAAMADVNYDFVKQQGDVESKFGPMVQTIVNTIIGVGLGLSIIGIGYGSCQYFGRIFKMDKDEGMEKIKAGSIGIGVFACFWAVIATIFNWVGL